MFVKIADINPPGKSILAYWENFLTDEDIQRILAMNEWNTLQKASLGTKYKYDEKIRISDIAWMQASPENADLWEKFSRVFSQVNSEYFQFNLSGFYEPMQLGRYAAKEKLNDSGHYSWHTDIVMHEKAMMRKLSMSLLLSDPDEFEGGDLQVHIDTNGPKSLEQKKGRAWFFPSWVLHQVTPITRGVRKSAVLWAGGPAFK
jgi:PKHD-type hydroxylase